MVKTSIDIYLTDRQKTSLAGRFLFYVSMGIKKETASVSFLWSMGDSKIAISNNRAFKAKNPGEGPPCGAWGTRTPYLNIANVTLYQMS